MIEQCKGTNAIGTALIDEEPTVVHADEHFMHANGFLTCSAAPIFDPRGDLLGVLDVSGDRHSYHPHTIGLVKMAVRMIENHWIDEEFRDALRLHFHGRSEAIGSLLEGIVAIDRDGRLLGANRIAQSILGTSGAELRRQSVTSLFGVSLAILVDSIRRSEVMPMELMASNGLRLYACAKADWRIAPKSRTESSEP